MSKRTFTIEYPPDGKYHISVSLLTALLRADSISKTEPIVTEVKDPDIMITRLEALSDSVLHLSTLIDFGDFSADWLVKQIREITS